MQLIEAWYTYMTIIVRLILSVSNVPMLLNSKTLQANLPDEIQWTVKSM